MQVVVQHRQEAAGTTPAPIFLHHLENNLRPRERQADRDSETPRGCGKEEKGKSGESTRCREGSELGETEEAARSVTSTGLQGTTQTGKKKADKPTRGYGGCGEWGGEERGAGVPGVWRGGEIWDGVLGPFDGGASSGMEMAFTCWFLEVGPWGHHYDIFISALRHFINK